MIISLGEAPIQAANSPSSLRTQGPITTGLSLWRQRRDGSLSDNKYHAVWVPASAGTTDEVAFRDVHMFGRILTNFGVSARSSSRDSELIPGLC
jgi:hypothetical protein